jgi:hypothetical protein
VGRKGGPAAIEVEGGPQLRRALKKFDARLGDLSAIHRDVGELVAAEAETLVPVDTGRLRDTIHSTRGKASASVLAGRSLVPYAGPIHFGWRARNIEPQPFLYDALDRRRDDVLDRYNDGIGDLVRRFDTEAPDVR